MKEREVIGSTRANPDGEHCPELSQGKCSYYTAFGQDRDNNPGKAESQVPSDHPYMTLPGMDTNFALQISKTSNTQQ